MPAVPPSLCPLPAPLSQQHPHVLKVTQNQVETGPHHGTGEAVSPGQALITNIQVLALARQGEGAEPERLGPIPAVQDPNGNRLGSDTTFPNLSLLLKDFNLLIEIF